MMWENRKSGNPGRQHHFAVRAGGQARRLLAAALCVACFACGGVAAVQGAGPEIGGTPKDHEYVILGGNHLDGDKGAEYTYVLVDDNDKTIWHGRDALNPNSAKITANGENYRGDYNVNYENGVYTLTKGNDTVHAYYYGKAELDGKNPHGYRVRMDYDASASTKPLYDPPEGVYRNKDTVYETSIKGSTQQQPNDILKKVQQTISDATVTTGSGETKVQTNLGETLQNVQAQGYVAAAYDGTAVPGNFTYLIKDDNGKGDYISLGNHDRGVDPDQFVAADTTRDGHSLVWSETEHSYVYTNGDQKTNVSLDNVYVINNRAGVFYNSDGSLYTGTVYGGSNDYLLTSKSDKDGKLYSYWGAEDKHQTLQSYSVDDFNKAIATVRGNEDKLLRNDINHIGLKTDTDSATIGLYRNGEDGKGGSVVPGELTLTQGGGTGGIGHDRTLTISSNYTETGAETGKETDTDPGTVAKAKASPLALAAEAETGGTTPAQTGSPAPTQIFSFGSQVGVEADLAGHERNGIQGTLHSLTINGVTYDQQVLDNHGAQIHNVGSGYDGHLYADSALNNAATIGDLNTVSNNLNTSVNHLSGEINRLGDRVDKVGAGAAALAALHPLDYDPEDKWDFAAGYGHYKDADATALGVFYRPNEDVLFSVGGSMGGGENMVNAGVSFKLGQGSHVSHNRAAMAAEIQQLKQENEQMRQDNEQMKQDNASLRQEMEALKKLVEEKLGTA